MPQVGPKKQKQTNKQKHMKKTNKKTRNSLYSIDQIVILQTILARKWRGFVGD